MHLSEQAGEIREYEDGEVVFEQGTPGEHLYIVVEGGIGIRRRSDLVATVLAEFGPGDMFGEISLVDRKPHSAQATAVGKTTLRLFDRDSFVEALADDPELALGVIGTLVERLRDTTDKLQSIATQHVLDRTEMILVQKAIIATDLEFEDGSL